MKTIKEMTDKELMNEYKNLYQSVYITECAGVHDLSRMLGIENELTVRGIGIEEDVTFIKDGEECLVDSDGCLIDNDGDAETDMENDRN